MMFRITFFRQHVSAAHPYRWRDLGPEPVVFCLPVEHGGYQINSNLTPSVELGAESQTLASQLHYPCNAVADLEERSYHDAIISLPDDDDDDLMNLLARGIRFLKAERMLVHRHAPVSRLTQSALFSDFLPMTSCFETLFHSFSNSSGWLSLL